VTNNEETYNRLRYLRNQGRLHSGTFIHPEIGYNFRMTDIQMAIGLVQLSKLNKIAQNKLNILERYKENLRGVSEVKFIHLEEHSSYIPFRIAIIAKEAHKLMEYLGNNNIQPRSFFYPLHRQPCFQKYKNYSHPNYELSDEKFSNAVSGYENGVCLPSFAALTIEQIDYVSLKIKEYYAEK